MDKIIRIPNIDKEELIRRMQGGVGMCEEAERLLSKIHPKDLSDLRKKILSIEDKDLLATMVNKEFLFFFFTRYYQFQLLNTPQLKEIIVHFMKKHKIGYMDDIDYKEMLGSEMSYKQALSILTIRLTRVEHGIEKTLAFIGDHIRITKKVKK